MVRFPLNSSPKIIKRWFDLTDKKGLQLWLDFLQIKSKNTLKQWLDFTDKKDCKYDQISIKFKPKNH